MKNPREKYLNDNMYRALVDMMVEQINQCNYTPSEMREAAVLASIIYEERKPPGFSIDTISEEEIEDIVCKHEHWVPAGYPENIYGKEYARVQSIYEVFCMDCNNFVNLLTRDLINNKGLIIDRR